MLMQIGSADTITAYSVEDNHLGVRQVFSMMMQVVIMFYILGRSWTDFKTSLLYIPMCLAGIIKYGETSWALLSTLYSNLGFTFADFLQYDDAIHLITLPAGDDELPEAKLILRAYYRFCWLKPHLENWLPSPPTDDDHKKLSIEDCEYEEVFKITDSELGFMYDMLYTKAPVVYTRAGLVLRFISFISLITTLCGFSVLFKDAFVYNISAGMIHFVLITCVILEVYQILKLPFSDWAIVQMIRHYKTFPILRPLLRWLAPKSATWIRWSNTMGQFNLIGFSLQSKYRKYSRIKTLRRWGLDMKLRKKLSLEQIEVHSEVKELVVKELREIEKIRKQDKDEFTKRGEWTIQRYQNELELNEGSKLIQQLKTTITKRPFDKNIVIWFITTNIFNDNPDYHDTTEASQMHAIMNLSNYMMYLLAVRSHVLSTTTADILFDYSCRTLQMWLTSKQPGVLSDLLSLPQRPPTEVPQIVASDEEKKIIGNWNLLKDVKELANSLLTLPDNEKRWNLIGSMWVEMLGYAASNCEMEYHSEHIRQGGELITHVWLLIAHTVPKYSSTSNDYDLGVGDHDEETPPASH